MLTNNLDFRLEPRLKDLYEIHRERAAKIDWSYHEFLPWDEAKDFKRVPWSPDQVTLPSGVITAVETALLTEVNLPWFTSHLDQTFKGSLSVIRDFVHTWTAEEDQHSSLLENYLLITRNVNPHRVHELRKMTVESGFELGFHTQVEAMAYTTIQELATEVFYLNVAKIAGRHDKNLATLLRRLAKDEILHYAFYREVVKSHLEIEPNFIYYVANVILNFKMPGTVMPDFENRMKIIAKEANYGPMEYFDQVLDVLVEFWGIRNLRPGSTEAENARINILKYHDRLKRFKQRQMSRQ